MSDTIDPKRFAECFERVANALQAAAPLATRLRRELGEQAEDAVQLERRLIAPFALCGTCVVLGLVVGARAARCSPVE